MVDDSVGGEDGDMLDSATRRMGVGVGEKRREGGESDGEHWCW